MDRLIMGSLIASCLIQKAPLLQQLTILSCISYTIFKDEFLSTHACLVLCASFLFLLTCCLVIFSAAAVVKPKQSAKGKPFKDLLDSDLEFENEYRVVPLQQMNCISDLFKNSYEFCKFRPVYGLLVGVGIIFLVMFLSFRMLIDDENVQKDWHLVSSMFIAPGILLTTVPLFLANAEIYIRDPKSTVYTYRPFQEHVEVPFKVMAGKALAVLVTSGYKNVITVLFFIACTLLSICCLAFVYTMTEDDVKEMQEKYEMRLLVVKDVRLLVVNLLTFAAMLETAMLYKKVMSSWKKAKGNVFGIIEKNWRWNLRAMEYLLPDVDVSTLEDLQAALENKEIQQLTDGEKHIFNYVKQPLWQTRLPFVGKVPRRRDEELAQENAETSARHDLEREVASISEPAERIDDQPDSFEKAANVVDDQRKPDQQTAPRRPVHVQPSTTDTVDEKTEYHQQAITGESVQPPNGIA